MIDKDNKDKENITNNESYMGLGLSVLIGVPIGTALGVAFDNVALGVGLGITFDVLSNFPLF